ncbi:MAG: hypothetical protein HC890_19785 [Chloroflexaceae bacterium]|nr:hypothetical protein [Chloroflexaceae bacterium]
MAQDLAEPSWWEAWDRRRSDGNEGAKTQGIQRFMRNLRERTLTLQKASGAVPLGRLCYVIHKR